MSIEVAEHLPPREAEVAIANICAHTTDVLFSSSPVDHREPAHVNVRPPEYWAQQFARHGFFRDVDYDATHVLPWAARFRKRQEPVHRIVHDYERRYWALLCDATDARNYSGETQRTLAATETERDALQAERDGLAAARDVLRAERDDLRRDHDRVATRLNQALDTIAQMERSRFWRLRLAWLRFRRLLSRGSSPEA